jgi:hypothetical protein
MIYTPDHYNEDNVLKVNFSLTLIMAYGLKYLGILLLPNVIQSPTLQKLAHHYFNLGFWVTSLPALVLLFISLRRVPSAGKTARWLWQRGRKFLFGGLALDVLMVLSYTALGFIRFDELTLTFLYTDLAVLFVLWKSHYIHDVFAEFPAYVAKK